MAIVGKISETCFVSHKKVNTASAGTDGIQKLFRKQDKNLDELIKKQL